MKGKVRSSPAIEVTGVSDELLSLLEDRIRSRRSPGRAAYIRELIRHDLLLAEENGGPTPDQTFREILAPLHLETRLRGYRDEELMDLLEEIRDEIYQEKHAEPAS